MDRGDVPDRIRCASYTHARRHPLVIGKLAIGRGRQAHLPTPITPAQLAVIVATVIVLLVTQPVWAHLGGFGNLAVMGLVPLGLSWTVRHFRMQGRSPMRMALGGLSYLGRSRTGKAHGRRPPSPSGRRLRCVVLVEP